MRQRFAPAFTQMAWALMLSSLPVGLAFGASDTCSNLGALPAVV